MNAEMLSKLSEHFDVAQATNVDPTNFIVVEAWEYFIDPRIDFSNIV